MKIRRLLHHRCRCLISCDGPWEYVVAGRAAAEIPTESVTLAALLHDICKTHFYTTSTRNVKNERTGKWEKQPYYTIDDKMPLGHGPKSAMIVKQYIALRLCCRSPPSQER